MSRGLGKGEHGRFSTPAEKEEYELTKIGDPLLSVENLQTKFDTSEGTIRAADGVSFSIQEGEILGLVGESGCGKSVTSRSIINLIQPPGYIDGGRVLFKNEDILSMSKEQLRHIRGNEISMIFQEPMSALNPVYDIGWQVGEPLRVHKNLKKSASREEAIRLLDEVGIPGAEDRVDDYPHQFSGGMRQRAMIAMALACEPDLLIADEPTTALDVTIEGQILELIQDLCDDKNMSVLFVTHDMGVIAEICDKVAVMYAGRIVEFAEVEALFEDPRHPYTKGLLQCIPDPEKGDQSLNPLEGNVPQLSETPDFCNFKDRCPKAVERCEDVDPRLREVSEGHFSACIWENPK